MLLGAETRPRIHHLLDRREDVLNPRRISRQLLDARFDVIELVGRLDDEVGLLAEHHDTGQYSFFVTRDCRRVLQSAEFPIDPSQSLGDRLTLRLQTGRAIQQPHHQHFALLQVLSDLPGDSVEGRFDLHELLAGRAFHDQAVVELQSFRNVVGWQLRLVDASFIQQLLRRCGDLGGVLHDGQAEAHRIRDFADIEFSFVRVRQFKRDRFFDLLANQVLREFCFKHQCHRFARLLKEPAGEVRHQPQVQQ